MESSMKIGNSPETMAPVTAGTDRPASADAGRAKTAEAAGGKTPEASAKIALSSNASALLAGVSEEGSFDAEKVGRISQAITEGKFGINAEAVADKLIANAQEMLSRATPH
ncbi:flagellar biosynthesis anti-sigma factor FlgM [Paucibacter sp. XJ19-41]|uniref:flagellar biosynthesis anti-sigma factor FlgM n=1 Tax=Paucibacter sp. XJ19-41 TaxID=2927824 RepID=UPI00234B1D17|nr:flagellar biosynthesis anti-sigma factor FlgM [Paucibacter sp. XJ19-41]